MGGGDNSSRSTSGNKRKGKGRKGRKKGKSRSRMPGKKKGKANVCMDQGAVEGGENEVQDESGEPDRFEDS
eukprot:10607610-Alexandrium_andersonii.AAC.1